MTNFKSYDNVIEESEFQEIYARLKQIHAPTAEFWYILYFTGMRFNELFSLPMSALYPGHMDGSLHEELESKEIDYVGYIVLENQAEDKVRKREGDDSIKRKPLKGRNKIHPKNNRIIPITDIDAWDILAIRHQAQDKLYQQKKYGREEQNYILFDDLMYMKAKRSLKQAYDDTSYNIKTFHDLRHTFCARFIGETRSFFLTRAILDHQSNAFERYLHIYEQISKKATKTKSKIKPIRKKNSA